jgi:hypothetical protein
MEVIQMPDDKNSQVTPVPAEGQKAAEPAKAVAEAAPPSAKMVPESDLLAVKAGKEGLEKKLTEVETALKTKVSDTENKLFTAEAKIKQLEDQLKNVNLTSTELAAVKAKLEVAEKSVTTTTSLLLDYKRQSIAAKYNIPADTLKDKTADQLSLFEEALKAVVGSKGASLGTGGYAVGTAGAGGAAKESNSDRLKRLISEHEEKKGVMRVSGNNKK